jgi:hypothetical protein
MKGGLLAGDKKVQCREPSGPMNVGAKGEVHYTPDLHGLGCLQALAGLRCLEAASLRARTV